MVKGRNECQATKMCIRSQGQQGGNNTNVGAAWNGKQQAIANSWQTNITWEKLAQRTTAAHRAVGISAK